MTTTLGQRLAAAMQRRGPLCIGIDPHPGLLAAWGRSDDAAGLERFSRGAVEALAGEVAALRCGLDATAWDRDGAEKCAKALGIPLDKVPGLYKPLPFDHARAHKLYSALFGEVHDLIDGKHLLVVPSGPLTVSRTVPDSA